MVLCIVFYRISTIIVNFTIVPDSSSGGCLNFYVDISNSDLTVHSLVALFTLKGISRIKFTQSYVETGGFLLDIS